MNEIAVQTRDLQKKMNRVQALQGVDFTFSANRLHGVIGPEGAGKTTLLRHLIGLLTPDQGTVAYFKDTQCVSFAEVRTLCAYMPQTQSLYGELSIHEHLEFFRTLYKLSNQEYQERRRKLLQITRLEEFQDRPAGQLSGGMYKKLGLMCALLAAPKLMLLDEPTNGVDPLSRRDFWRLLHDLKKEEITILVTTSYLEEALKCEEVHLLFAGQNLMEGKPVDILKAQKCRSFDEVFLRYDSSREFLI